MSIYEISVKDANGIPIIVGNKYFVKGNNGRCLTALCCTCYKGREIEVTNIKESSSSLRCISGKDTTINSYKRCTFDPRDLVLSTPISWKDRLKVLKE